MNGTFYRLVLNSTGNGTAPDAGSPSCMVRHKVKQVSTSFVNPYRGGRQPITVTPVAALDSDGYLRVYFGTGKFDDAALAPNDRTDNSTMTFYCLREPLNRNQANDTAWCGGTSHLTTPMNVLTKCSEDNVTRKYRWTTVNASNVSIPDSGSCFNCMFDLVKGGERLVDSALVAGGLVFFTTFVPKYDVCAAGGDAYLYVLDYMCRPLQNPGNIIQQGGTDESFYNLKSKTWTTGTPPNFVGAIRVALGGGMPSRPVLDSSATSIFVQTSDARMIRIKVDLGPGGHSKVQGWTRED